MPQCSAYVGEKNDTVYLVARNFVEGGPSIASSFQIEKSLHGAPSQLLDALRRCFSACKEVPDRELYDSKSMQFSLNGLFKFLKVSSWKQLQDRYRCVDLTSLGNEVEIMPTKRQGGEYIHLPEFAKRSELVPSTFHRLFLQQLARCQ